MNSSKPDIEPVEMSLWMKWKVPLLRIHFVVFLTLFNLLLVTCGTWGWESIETDNEEMLNIFGVISLDDSLESFVIVHKTLDTAGPIDEVVGRDTVYYEAWEYFDYDLNQTVRDTFWYDPPWIRTLYESRYVVKDAQVILSDGQNEYLFERAPRAQQHVWDSYYWGIYSDPAIYRNIDGTFTPQPDTEYTLSVTTESGLSATGTTTTPVIPRIKESLLPDTLSIRDLFTVEWEYDDDYVSTMATDAQDTQEGRQWICGIEQHSVQERGDTTWVSSLETWCLDYPNEGEEDLVVPIELRLRYLDDNYYDYFVSTGEVEDISNILLGEGGIARGYGIDGGFGVFGSLSADWTYRLATP